MRFFIILSTFLLCSCSTISEGLSNSNNKKARKEYKNYLRLIEKPNFPINIDSTNYPVEKLYKLTKVKSNYTEQFVSFPSPNRENIDDWKKWYKINKSNIYFDSKHNIIKVNKDVKYIYKDPKMLFLRYLNLIKKIDDKKYYVEKEFNYANEKLNRLTNISIYDDMIYAEEYETFIYQQITFDKWLDWFELNKDKLIWDIDNQEMSLKNI